MLALLAAATLAPLLAVHGNTLRAQNGIGLSVAFPTMAPRPVQACNFRGAGLLGASNARPSTPATWPENTTSYGCSKAGFEPVGVLALRQYFATTADHNHEVVLSFIAKVKRCDHVADVSAN